MVNLVIGNHSVALPLIAVDWLCEGGKRKRAASLSRRVTDISRSVSFVF